MLLVRLHVLHNRYELQRVDLRVTALVINPDSASYRLSLRLMHLDPMQMESSIPRKIFSSVKSTYNASNVMFSLSVVQLLKQALLNHAQVLMNVQMVLHRLKLNMFGHLQ